MGWASRVNPNTTPERQRVFRAQEEMRAMLCLFPDRTTYETWCEAREITNEQRAHMELFLPPRLQHEGSV